MNDNNRHSPFLLPDPPTIPESLSGAVFLYFENPILTTPPDVVTNDSFELLSLIQKRKPEWGHVFLNLLNAWHQQGLEFKNTLDAIAPLRHRCKIIYLSYACDPDALEDSTSLITSAGFTLDSVTQFINPYQASGEIIRHVMLETYLELDQDIEALYNYCADLFTQKPPLQLLTKGYFLRVKFLSKIREGPVLLTNERLSQFLDKLPVETETQISEDIDDEVIAWELFRQILSPHLDPLNIERAKLINELLQSRKEEIERLRLKCHVLAEQVRQPKTLQDLVNQIEKLIRTKVKREIAELLQLNRQALEAFLTSIFADEKTWFAVSSFIASVVTGHVYITTGAALAALSSIGSKAFKAAADRRQKLKQNDYALVYTISRKVS